MPRRRVPHERLNGLCNAILNATAQRHSDVQSLSR